MVAAMSSNGDPEVREGGCAVPKGGGEVSDSGCNVLKGGGEVSDDGHDLPKGGSEVLDGGHYVGRWRLPRGRALAEEQRRRSAAGITPLARGRGYQSG